MPSSTRSSSRTSLYRLTSAAALAALFVGGPLSSSAHAEAVVVPLGTASAFSVLAGSTVTNTGPTTVSRDIGLHPGTAVTGASGLTVGGTYHVSDAVALRAKTDLTTGFNNAARQGPIMPVGADLVGESLVGGVYNTAGAMHLSGVLTLDAGTNPDSVWVFQAGSSLITEPGAEVRFLNGVGNPCNVFWQVGSSATLDTGTSFIGTIMAEASITMNTRASLEGRALARSGAVNLDTNVITGSGCANEATVPAGTDTPPAPSSPTPTTTPGATGGSGDSGSTTGQGGTGGTSGTTPGDTVFTGEQVTRIPTGSVDTGYAGPVNPNGALGGLVGGAVFAIVGGLATLAVRRRQRG